MSNGLQLSVLEGHLWQAANVIRDPVDAADFKAHIFPLLFFKRIRAGQVLVSEEM
jgi:type I restriction enzyme M protein